MRILIIATMVLGLTAVSAQAQMGGGRRHGNENGQKADNTPKVDEKAYKAALERIPEPKDKYDPWSGARSNEPAKKSK
ncbi:hypothetical protein [uncultured Bradyrhizobium sp.]|jgi:hypothetical protein|uniref:hypothetical protein n=1 Tax=uncultured Bradyrhizobium sp. TaxID=199684 RepID=UPI002610DBE0|nr:hypothetical protein [uncultured Bradyrhizobium sp.]